MNTKKSSKAAKNSAIPSVRSKATRKLKAAPAFDDLPIAEQRVVIAQDLIERLDAKKFVAKAGDYLRVSLPKQATANGDVQVQEVLRGKQCRGCQLGGIFVCAIDRHNDLKLVNLRNQRLNGMGDGDMRRYLKRWFTNATLSEMERAFECWGQYMELEDIQPSPKARMRLIAENIIANKGQFNGKQLLKRHTT